jgi:hypothetical protein
VASCYYLLRARIQQLGRFRIQDGERLERNRRIEHNTGCTAPRRSAGRSKPNLKHECKGAMQEPEYFTAVPARLSSKERSNPSIEGTLSGLRPPSAPHVKR